MTRLLVDHNFEDEVVAELLALGHDAITARSVGLDAVPDPDLLAAATADGRIVLTHDRDYITLHKSGLPHAGIVFATIDRDFPALAARIHAELTTESTLAGLLVRVYKPNPPKKAP